MGSKKERKETGDYKHKDELLHQKNAAQNRLEDERGSLFCLCR